jgi:hypothetical protein
MLSNTASYDTPSTTHAGPRLFISMVSNGADMASIIHHMLDPRLVKLYHMTCRASATSLADHHRQVDWHPMTRTALN